MLKKSTYCMFPQGAVLRLNEYVRFPELVLSIVSEGSCVGGTSSCFGAKWSVMSCGVAHDMDSYIHGYMDTYIHTYHTIPYHTIPYHTIPYHTTPYHTIHTYSMRLTEYLQQTRCAAYARAKRSLNKPHNQQRCSTIHDISSNKTCNLPP